MRQGEGAGGLHLEDTLRLGSMAAIRARARSREVRKPLVGCVVRKSDHVICEYIL